jgi:hypothetical protein
VKKRHDKDACTTSCSYDENGHRILISEAYFSFSGEFKIRSFLGHLNPL